MSIKIKIYYPHLKVLTDNLDVVEVTGSSIGQCLNELAERFPGIRKKIFNDHGKLLHFINIIHNNNSTHLNPDPLLIQVRDGDVIGITLLIAGG